MRRRSVTPKLRRKYLKRLAAYEKRRLKKIKEVEDALDDKPKQIEFLTFGSITGRTSSRIRMLPPYQNIYRKIK